MAGPQQQQLLTDPFASAISVLGGFLRGDERFAVTGASGWFGRTALEILSRTLGDEFDDHVLAYTGTTPAVELRDGRNMVCRPLPDLLAQDPSPTHLLHFAYLTRDRVEELGVAEYVSANSAITTLMVRAVDRHAPRGLLFTSSGAVYNPDRSLASDLETNPYGALKRLDELALCSAMSDTGGHTVIPRVFSVSGPYMTKAHLYALGELVEMALAGRPLMVRARHPVRRSYVAVADVLAVAFGPLFDPTCESDVVFDSGGPVVEVGELAQTICTVLGRPADAVVREWDPDAPADDYFGDPSQMDDLASRYGVQPASLEDQIRLTAGGLK